MSSRKKIIIATLTAPLVAPIAFFLGMLLIGLNEFDDLSDVCRAFTLIFLFAIPVSYGAMVLLGIPYYSILKKLERDNNTTLVTGGVVFGAAVFITFVALMRGSLRSLSSDLENLAFALFIGAVLGGLVALCFAKMRA